MMWIWRWMWWGTGMPVGSFYLPIVPQPRIASGSHSDGVSDTKRRRRQCVHRRCGSVGRMRAGRRSRGALRRRGWTRARGGWMSMQGVVTRGSVHPRCTHPRRRRSSTLLFRCRCWRPEPPRARRQARASRASAS
ncbi:hypothetical protein K438DRAFT_1888443, partial [Mycena galopus ATCC 62051]